MLAYLNHIPSYPHLCILKFYLIKIPTIPCYTFSYPFIFIHIISSV